MIIWYIFNLGKSLSFSDLKVAYILIHNIRYHRIKFQQNLLWRDQIDEYWPLNVTMTKSASNEIFKKLKLELSQLCTLHFITQTWIRFCFTICIVRMMRIFAAASAIAETIALISTSTFVSAIINAGANIFLGINTIDLTGLDSFTRLHGKRRTYYIMK